MANTMKELWNTDGVAYGAWLSLPDTASAEIVSRVGYDYCCVDMQHGYADYRTAVMMLQAINLGQSAPTVRVPWNEPGIIGRMLDAGAMNLIVPMVNSVAEARAAVAACRYPPLGARSYGPIRASIQEGAGYYSSANEEVACIPMIETKRAVDQIDAILSVPGIDAVYVGPSDLAISYGLPPGGDNDDPEFTAAITKIVERCAAHEVVAGIHASPELTPKRAEQGFKMITVTSDSVALGSSMARELKSARSSGEPSGAEESGSLY